MSVGGYEMTRQMYSILLAVSDIDEYATADIACLAGLRTSPVRYQLKKLETEGLVESSKEGGTTYWVKTPMGAQVVSSGAYASEWGK